MKYVNISYNYQMIFRCINLKKYYALNDFIDIDFFTH